MSCQVIRNVIGEAPWQDFRGQRGTCRPGRRGAPSTRMPDRTLSLRHAAARLTWLAALAPVAAALEEWGNGGWERVGAISFAVIWAVVLTVALSELVIAFRSREGRLRASLWLALVALANPWAAPLIEALLGGWAIHGIRVRRELSRELGQHVFSGRGLKFAVSVMGLGLFGFGWLFSAVETRQDLTVGDGVWFALVTAATVGYGDIVPTTSGGRVIGAVLMILGVVVVGLLTGAVAERFTRNRRPERDVARQLDELATRLERIEAGLALKTDGS